MRMMDDAAFLAWLAEAGIADVSGPRGGSVWLAFAADRARLQAFGRVLVPRSD
jgi:hypothetical protein